jgi:ketosteroid isomerase-like protein
MSQENVELVRRSVELWSSANWEEFAATHDPHVVILPPEDWPDGEVEYGVDAWVRQSMRLKEPWDKELTRVDQLRETGDSVLCRIQWNTTGRDSGIAVQTEFWGVYTLVAGKIIRIAFFLDRSKALEASGFSE